MDSPDPPPPPPSPTDYASEIEAKRQQLQNDLNQKASAYNEQVNAFNSSLSGLYGQYSPLQSNIYGLNLTNVDDLGAGYRTQLQNIQNSLAGLQRPSAFQYQSTYTFPEYANATITLSAPTLSSVNDSLYNSLGSGIGSSQTSLTDWLNKRTGAETAYKNFWTSLYGSATPELDRASKLDLTGYANSGFDRSGFNNLNSRAAGFMSDIYGDFNFDQEKLTRDLIGQIGSRYNQLDADKTAEQNRIRNFSTGLQNQLNEYANTFAGYTIRDEDRLKAMQDALRTKSQEALGFQSPLSFDFTGLSNQYNSLSSSIQNRLAEREREMARIRQAQTDFYNKAAQLYGNASGMDYYSGANISDLGNRIAALNNDMTGFSSLLDFDFGQARGQVDEAAKQMQTLQQQRRDALQALLARGQGFSQGLGDIPLYDENKFNARLQQANEVLADLGLFTGGDVQNYRSGVETAQQQIRDRLQQLYDYRGDVETRAKGLLSQFTGQSFYDTDAVQAARDGDFSKLLAEITQYGAGQANDEAAAIRSRLDSELARLTQEAEAKRSLAQQEASSLSSIIGSDQIYSVNGIPLTAEEYSALLRQKQMEEQAQSGNNAFLQALGILS